MFSSFLSDIATKPGETGTFPMWMLIGGREEHSLSAMHPCTDPQCLEQQIFANFKTNINALLWTIIHIRVNGQQISCATNSKGLSNTGKWQQKLVVLLLCVHCSKNKYCLYLDCMFRKIRSLLIVDFLKLQHFKLSLQVSVMHSQTFTIRYINKGRFVKYEILP